MPHHLHCALPGVVVALLMVIALRSPAAPDSAPPSVPRERPPQMTPPRADVQPFEYVDAEIPFYPAGEKWGKQSEPQLKMQKPLDAAESVKHFVTPIGFDVELFASEPHIGKPISMTWDARGRLWLAETVDYPNELQPEGQGHDRIRICEDTDGDGRADKFTVFAENLSIPTGLVHAGGGLVVLQPPHTLFLKDTDGDDRADERKFLFTGWGTSDTHAGPSNLRYGPDNWLYGMLGYAGFEGTVGGVRHSFRQGFFRFRPDGSQLEFLRSTDNNSWGLGFTEDGLLFGSTANNGPSVHMPIANRYYETVRGWSPSMLHPISDDSNYYPVTKKVRQMDWHGRFTAAAGHAIYTARTYPKEYWNRTAFVTEPTGHLAATFVLRPDGAGFRSHNAWNLAASDDEWSAPIMAEVGPDGNVWVIDWYNFIIQHNPTPIGYKTGKHNAYETNLRDKRHGRIYRIIHKDAKPSVIPKLTGADVPDLVATLKHPNMLWRLHAQRLLVERGQLDIVPALAALIEDQSTDELGLNVGAMHAIWTLQGLASAHGEWLESVVAAAQSGLNHPSKAVRRQSLLALPDSKRSTDAILSSKALADQDPLLRLAAFLALSDQNASPAAAEAVAAAWRDSENLKDRVLRDALTCAAARNGDVFLELIATRSPPSEVSSEGAALIQRVGEHFARSESSRGIDQVLIAMSRATPAIAQPAIAGICRGWPSRREPIKINDDADAAIKTLFENLPQQRAELAKLLKKLGSKHAEATSRSLAGEFLATLQDEANAERDRLIAARQYVQLRSADPAAADALLALIAPRSPPEFADKLLAALEFSEASETGRAICRRLAELTPAQRSVGVRLLLARVDWTPALLDAIEQGGVSVTELALDQRQVLATHPDPQLAERAAKLLKQSGGIPSADRRQVLHDLLPQLQQNGNAAAGKLAFAKHCSKCHTHSGEGSKVGPDLTGMAVHPKAELAKHILDPSSNVEGTYRAYTIATTDGKVFTGLLTAETRTTVEIADAEGKSHKILRDEIDVLKASPKSLMPEGFEKTLSTDELVNVLEFLTQRPRFLPIPLEKVATTITTRDMFSDVPVIRERLEFEDWSPKTVAGVPFQLIDPARDKRPNAILLYCDRAKSLRSMPRSIELPCNARAKAVHLLGCVSGWGFPATEKGSVSMVVRLHYIDGQTEEQALRNGYELADFNGVHDVPNSKLAFRLAGNRQLRCLAIEPKRRELIAKIELAKGPDDTAPVILAVTVETAGE
jgi:putative membrane-bound dehydrogenase-like protein